MHFSSLVSNPPDVRLPKVPATFAVFTPKAPVFLGSLQLSGIPQTAEGGKRQQQSRRVEVAAA